MRLWKIGCLGLMGVSLLQTTASAQLLKRLEQRLNDAATRLAPPANGAPTPATAPGYLGLTADETDGRQGVVILGTKAASPAETAGLKKDDIITAINGQPVTNLDDFQAQLDQVSAGQKAQFTLLRGNEALSLTATLVSRQTPPVNRLGAEDPGPPPGEPLAEVPGTSIPGTPAAEESSILRTPADAAARASLGVSVVPLTEEARVANGLSITRGALIAAIRPGGPADRAGLPLGGVIVAVDGQRVNTAEELVAIIGASRPGQEVEVSYYRGITLARRTIRLSPVALDARGTPPPPTPNPPGSNPPAIGGLLGGAAADRPLARRVGEVLDNLARPAGGAPAGQMEDIAALRSQVELLQATVRSLEDRLLKLEAKEAGPARAVPVVPPPVEPLPADPAGGTRKPTLPLSPPETPALPTPPALP